MKIEHADTAGSHDDNLFSYLMARYVIAYGVNLSRFRIYKKLKSTVENKANNGLRSDEEYVRNISNVLRANFNSTYNSNQSIAQQEIIDQYRQQQIRNKELEEYNKFEQGVNIDRTKSSFERIFSLNNTLNRG